MGKRKNEPTWLDLILGSDPSKRKSSERRDRTPTRATHEGAKQKIANALEGRGWDNAKKSRFHGYLSKNYRETKDSLSQSELNSIADQFDRQDKSTYNNSRGRR